jgi:hypothetical protein
MIDVGSGGGSEDEPADVATASCGKWHHHLLSAELGGTYAIDSVDSSELNPQSLGDPGASIQLLEV